MKKALCVSSVCAFLLFWGGVIHAENYRDDFYRGNIAYEKGDYAGAVKEYTACIDAGYESGNLYYNLGNAYYKAGNTGRAILFYEKALMLMPRDADTRANLAFVMTGIEDRPEDDRPAWFLRFFSFFVSDVSLDGLTVLCAVCWWAVFICAVTYLFLRGKWQGGPRYVAAAGITFLFLSVMLVLRLAFFDMVQNGIILDKEVEVKYGPTEADATAFTLHEGSKVRVENIAHDWVQVWFSAGKAGWVRKNSIGII
jgi:tetratricopeptide (TPR) repeat protein